MNGWHVAYIKAIQLLTQLILKPGNVKGQDVVVLACSLIRYMI